MGERANADTDAGPFVVRHRRVIAAGAALTLVFMFAAHAWHWHFPYRPAGAAGEWPLLAAALALGVLASLVLSAAWPALAPARMAAGALSAIAAFALLQIADPFAGRRTWRYAPPHCDFAVEFPHRPTIMAGDLRVGAQTRPVTRAIDIDVGEATALSAECLAFERDLPDAGRRAALDGAEAHLKALAARLKLRIDRVARAGDTVVVSGLSDDGRTENNEVMLKRGEARATLGPSSLLVLWAWTTWRAGTPAAAEPAAFFASLRPARP